MKSLRKSFGDWIRIANINFSETVKERVYRVLSGSGAHWALPNCSGDFHREPMKKTEKAYAAAGVDIALADRLLKKVKPALKEAMRPESLGVIGGFGGLFDISKLKAKHPVLVSSTDSVGTKVRVATLTGEYRYLGADIVNHCANDIAVCGAEPLFFLDYYATSKLEERAYVNLLRGLARACRAANIALVGGETAELPGVYTEGEFDLVGTVVGVVDKPGILTGEAVRPGDTVIGLASSGLHTNGYSLARRIFFERFGLGPGDPLPGVKSRQTVGGALVKPHVNYAPFILRACAELNSARRAAQRRGNRFFAAAHITGGGLTGNLPRVLPSDCDAEIETGAWKRPPVFASLAAVGEVSFEELHEVFNMGVGLVTVVDPSAAEAALALAKDCGHTAWKVGTVTKGSGRVALQS